MTLESIERSGLATWVVFRHLVARAMVTGLSLVAAGCSQSALLPQADSLERRCRPLLLSEVLAASDVQSLVDATFTISNPEDFTVALRFDGAGCSCYGVHHDDRKLAAGEILTLDPQSNLQIRLEIPGPTTAGEPRFSAHFTRIHPSQPEESFFVSLTVPILADAMLTPEVATIGYRPGESIRPTPLRLVRSSREQASLSRPPQTSPPSELASIAAWREVSIEQVDESLWRSTWESEVQVTLPDGDREVHTLMLGIDPFESDVPGRSLTLRLIVQPQFGIRGPSRIALGTWRLSDGPRKRRLLLSSADQRPFRITRWESSQAAVRIEPESEAAALTHWLTVEVQSRQPGPLEGELICHTDHPESPIVRFHAHGDVRPDDSDVTATLAE